MPTSAPEPTETVHTHQTASPVEPLVESVRRAIDSGDYQTLHPTLATLHPADFADLLEYLDRDARRSLLTALQETLPIAVLAELDGGIRDEVLDLLPDRFLSQALGQLDSDDAVDIVEDLDPREAKSLLSQVETGARWAVEDALRYPQYSAGRLMERAFVALPEGFQVGQAIDFMREAETLPSDFYVLYLVDTQFRPVGTVALSRLMRAPRATQLSAIATREITSYPPEMDQEELAYRFRQYGLVTVPITDARSGRLLGVVTVDDVVHVIDEEAEDDLLKLVGLAGGESDMQESLVVTARSRFVWLFVNLLTAIAAAIVIFYFQDAIDERALLAVLLPIVASMGGNAGTQTLAVAVRALATKTLARANAWRYVRKEALVGLINGIAFALIAGAGASLIFPDEGWLLGLAVALAMVVNLLVAALSGTLIPLTLQRLGVDPANASTVFLTTITDVIGFLAFLGLAVWLLA